MPVNFYWSVNLSTSIITLLYYIWCSISVEIVKLLKNKTAFHKHLFLPAGEIDLVSPKVDVGVGENNADFVEKAGHKVVRGVEDGVYGTKGTWRSATRVAWGQKTSLTYTKFRHQGL